MFHLTAAFMWVITVIVSWGFVVGFLSSLFLFFTAFSQAVKLNIRKRLQAEKYDHQRVDFLSETREADRKPVSNLPVTIKMPELDSAGVTYADEEVTFIGMLCDISAKGATIITRRFVPVGVTMLISCNEKKLNFPLWQAEIKNINISNIGLRVGIQFLKPLSQYV